MLDQLSIVGSAVELMGRGQYEGRILSEEVLHEIPSEGSAMGAEEEDRERATGRLHMDQSIQLNGVSQRLANWSLDVRYL